MTSALLPINSTPWERSVADAMPVSTAMQSAIAPLRTAKLVNPTPTMLPFLVYEYGLGELTPYVPNLTNLITQGVGWQRLRGTVSAVAIGLAWIGYSATIEEAATSRRFWNSFQLRFPTLPANDDPDLERIEGITSLSVPLRSKLRRGVFGYDVGPALGDGSRWDRAMFEHESGIAVTPAGTLWSFGRTLEIEHTLTEAEGMALGNWLEPEAEVYWVDLNYPWVDADFYWIDDAATQRAALMGNWFIDRQLYLRLSDSSDNVIGYRRCRVARSVQLAANGVYKLGAQTYNPRNSSGLVYIEAMTGFEDADGVVCASIALMANATRADGVKPGKLWLEPDELSGGVPFAQRETSIPLRRTVRERFKFMLRF